MGLRLRMHYGLSKIMFMQCSIYYIDHQTQSSKSPVIHFVCSHTLYNYNTYIYVIIVLIMVVCINMAQQINTIHLTIHALEQL